MILRNAFGLVVILFFSPINAHSNEYRCVWEASRSMSSQIFTPLASQVSIRGVVRITDDEVTYESVKFLRARNIPVQKGPNGSSLVVYRGGGQMFTVAYTSDGQVMISLMRSNEEKTQYAGVCR